MSERRELSFFQMLLAATCAVAPLTLWWLGVFGLVEVLLVEIFLHWGVLYALGVGWVVRPTDRLAQRYENRQQGLARTRPPWLKVTVLFALWVAVAVLYSAVTSGNGTS